MRKGMGIVVVPIVDDTGVATWTVSRFIAASRVHMLAIGHCNALSRTTNGSTIWRKALVIFLGRWPTARHRSILSAHCIAQYCDW